MTRPPTMDETKGAIRTLLAGLPVGTELRFYWLDGCQHLDCADAEGETLTVKLIRRGDGCLGISFAESAKSL